MDSTDREREDAVTAEIIASITEPLSPQADLLDRLINREIPDVEDLAATGELIDGWAASQWIDTGRGEFTVLVVDGPLSAGQLAAIQAIAGND